MKIFKQRQRIIQLEKKLGETKDALEKSESESVNWSIRAKQLDQTITDMKSITAQIEKERDGLRKKVKTQLESELVVTSLKIIFEMMKPEAKPESPYLSQLAAQQQSLQQQLSGMNQLYGTSLLGSLGLGGLQGLLPV